MSRFESKLPVPETSAPRPSARLRQLLTPERRDWLRAKAHQYRAYLLCVGVPTVVTALYFLLLAAPQYMSEAHFLVMSGAGAQKSGDGGAGQMQSSPAGDTHTLAVVDFMQSRDAVANLDMKVDLKTIYRRPMLDLVARMESSPTLEEMYNYLFRHGAMIHVSYDFMNFVGVVKVYAFTAADAHTVADTLLTLGDQLVDRLKKRALEDALRVARAEVKRAEERVVAAGEKITDFRTHQHELDYSKSADTILDVVAKLEGNLAQARADLTAARAYMQPDSSRFIELSNQVKALESQIQAQKGRLTGAGQAIAPEMATYERLQLERTFANQDYQLASQALEQAYLQVQKQQLFLVRTVDARVPEKSEYPRALVIVLTLWVTLSVAYGIGWLILAGVREHAG